MISRSRRSRCLAIVLVMCLLGGLSVCVAVGQVFEPSASPTQPSQPTTHVSDFVVAKDEANHKLSFKWTVTNDEDVAITDTPYVKLYGIAHSPAPLIGEIRGETKDVPPHTTVTKNSTNDSTAWTLPDIPVKTACVNTIDLYNGTTFFGNTTERCITFSGDGFELYPWGTTASATPSAASAALAGMPMYVAAGVIVAAVAVGIVYVGLRKR